MADAEKPATPSRRDLPERTARFAEAVVLFARQLDRNVVTMPLINQLVRASTSPGANYAEADEAVSRKDFRHSIAICKKECRETKYWLRLIAAAIPAAKDRARELWSEAHQLHLIFAAIYRKSAEPKN